jgi:hypothetical protein
MINMKKNLGNVDRAIRLIAGFAIVIAFYMGLFQGTAATVLLVMAEILILTALFNFCPLYSLLGIKTGSSRK